jgi:hypothetical protein
MPNGDREKDFATDDTIISVLPAADNHRFNMLLSGLSLVLDMCMCDEFQLTPEEWLHQELASTIAGLVVAIYPDDPRSAVDNFAEHVKGYIEVEARRQERGDIIRCVPLLLPTKK